jgi:glycosyltransferase involved in cell wall biosynthesis
MTVGAAAAGERIPVGVWTEWPAGARWKNEGMTRLLGFLIEGVALGGAYIFRIVLPDAIRLEAEEDLLALDAVPGLDYSLHSPGDPKLESDDFVALADFANKKVPVQGWIVLFPYFQHALKLTAPIATIFPDAIPAVFPVPDFGAWGSEGYHARWRDQVRKLLDGSDRVVTFSHHVAEHQATKLFGVDPSKIRVVPHAPPDLSPLAPYAARRKRTQESRGVAGAILRKHAAERGWSRLADFPFEEIDYVAVSTQDRVTKNIRIIADGVREIVREDRRSLKLLMTAPIHFGAAWTPLPNLIEAEQLLGDVVSMTDLPRDVHAAFYHAAAVVVHPSIFEGGLGPFPFYEAVSVGTPCVMADGPHIRELLRDEPNLAQYVFDANDRAGVVRLVRDVLKDRASALKVQSSIFSKLKKYGWDDVASAYAGAAVEGD